MDPARSFMAEEPLVGGHTTATVVRVGDTVRRSRGPRSDFVAELLALLGAVDFPYAPRYLGVDDQGRDVLSYIEGVTTSHPSERHPTAYPNAGKMLRELHDVTAGHSLAETSECVRHGDPGPYNVICRAGRPVAFIDWDAARPGTRLDDLGYLAWTWCILTVGNVPIGDQALHMRQLRDGYGDVDGLELLRAVLAAQDSVIVSEGAIETDPVQSDARRGHARRAVAWATADQALLRDNWAAFLLALGI